MATCSAGTEDNLEYLPPEVWGFDPCFQAFNKMYIKDVLSMPEYPTSKGAYTYKNHPVYKVDIVGTVVQVDQNQKCFMYGVDDGTEVITCCCWKESLFAPKFTDTDTESLKSVLPPGLFRKAEEVLANQELVYRLGDCIKVRGKIKIFREKREIIASYHNKLIDPMAPVLRMSELPCIYRNVYDKPFVLPENVQQELEYRELDGSSCLLQSEEQIVYHLKKTILAKINIDDITEFMLSEATTWEEVETLLTKVTTSVDVPRVTEKCLRLLEHSGIVCQRCDKPSQYEVLGSDSPLTRKIVDILKTECKKPKYSEIGCHIRYILDTLQKTLQYSGVNLACVQKCLDFLVTQSDVIMTSERHYLNINTF